MSDVCVGGGVSCVPLAAPVWVVQVVLLQPPAHQLHHKAASIDRGGGVQGRDDPRQRSCRQAAAAAGQAGKQQQQQGVWGAAACLTVLCVACAARHTRSLCLAT